VSYRNDIVLHKEMVNLELARLGKPLVNSKGILGIDKIIANVVESLTCKEQEDIIGIWGMGGINKTTLYKKLLKPYWINFIHAFMISLKTLSMLNLMVIVDIVQLLPYYVWVKIHDLWFVIIYLKNLQNGLISI